MTPQVTHGTAQTPPEANIVPQRRRSSRLWWIPVIIAACISVALMTQVYRANGLRIAIRFGDAAGLEEGAGLVHRGVRVGVVRSVTLDDDLRSVRVEAELAPHAEGLAVDGTRFWIVKPEVRLDRVSGLETILGPRYIEVDPAPTMEDAKVARRFDGLDEPPASGQAGGLCVVLMARSAGKIRAGSAVLYRDLRVGGVTSVSLTPDGSAVMIEAMIERSKAGLVRENSRFWDASAVGVDFSWARGVSLEAGSIDTLLRGAVGLATPDRPGDRVADGAVFDLALGAQDAWLDWAPSLLDEADALIVD